MPDFPRLIEFAFPLKQTSLDSVHEKSVRHGNISTLHIWPARRPLAACRAALIATLLPDPSAQQKPDNMPDKEWEDQLRRQRRELCEKFGGTVEKEIEKKKRPDGSTVEREKEVTKGGILHWGREKENADTLEWFRKAIRKAHAGRAPKVLDPFAGGGAIPLEAMRLGCAAAAIDINPVAWFLLKCTLEYPQKLAGKTRPLPQFILRDRGFMEAFLKSKGQSKAQIQRRLEKLGHLDDQMSLAKLDLAEGDLEADLAWHVRAWGCWVLDQARRELAQFYPTYADFEPLKKNLLPFEPQPMRQVPRSANATCSSETLNAEFGATYLAQETKPRWVAKPTVAYLWARTVPCKNCRATIPLLKTRWLCKRDNKRVLLTMEPKPDRTGVQFGVQKDVPAAGGTAAHRKTNDRKLAEGTMSRSGAKCPCCKSIMTTEDIRLEGKTGHLSATMTAVVTEGLAGKEYRAPVEEEITLVSQAEAHLDSIYTDIPFGIPTETITEDAKRNTWCVQYGIDQFQKYFTRRQLLSMGVFTAKTRALRGHLVAPAYDEDWQEAITAFLACGVSRLADSLSTGVTWTTGGEFPGHTFVRYALPLVWDYCETNPLTDTGGNYSGAIDWIARVATHLLSASAAAEKPSITCTSSKRMQSSDPVDVILTDPPYYDAVGYSCLMDYFYVWLRRILDNNAFAQPCAPKWSTDNNDGELVDDASRFGGDRQKSKTAYESGMAEVFAHCFSRLSPGGRLVVVFAHKTPDAWETLVGAMVKAGFVVDASWPIMTERSVRMRAQSSAALASSVWLVCRKRPEAAGPGWDKDVLEQMRKKIRTRLNEFWDAGIRGPDFVWAATGPAMEAYSQHPVVLKANQPKERMTVTEFLNHARRLVVDYIVGQVLSGDQARGQQASATDRLDEVTAYYLLHRHDFAFGEAPSGACILYAVSCGLSDSDLVTTWDLIHTARPESPVGGEDDPAEDEDEEPTGDEEPSGGKMKLKTWRQRKSKSLGYDAPTGKPVPLIDRIHRLMYLWHGGDLHKVDEYLDDHGLRRHELFKRLLQSIIELSDAGGEERSLLESLSNHLGIKGAVKDDKQIPLPTSE